MNNIIKRWALRGIDHPAFLHERINLFAKAIFSWQRFSLENLEKRFLSISLKTNLFFKLMRLVFISVQISERTVWLTLNHNGITKESLSTGTFLHYGGPYSVSGLDRERHFWREFLT